ncbi:DNA repair protein [Flavobacterium sp. TP390]|uniref:DNA repair protein n=1 Tax=Flavobacterium profundi TaxID=1774945 RepID=A0A6I4IK52_9FLAO|nr:JAB domain-containing protein [Flavobacterium profundi]MVO08559.1 DNA repair protein [Flavobacterium profundi]
MKVAEIKVSYSNIQSVKLKLTDSNILFKFLLSKWNMDIIEFQEECKLVLVNKANIVLGIYDLSKGGISGTVVDIKIILSVALKCHASGIVLVHNHPSGNLIPSEADKQITKKLKQACDLIEIILLDHLIISRENYYSFCDSGNL